MSTAPKTRSARCGRRAIRWMKARGSRRRRETKAIMSSPLEGEESLCDQSNKNGLKQRPDRRFQLFRLGLGRIARHRLALAVHQELGEIPLDRFGAQQARLFLLQILEEGVGFGAVDFDLVEQGKGDAIVAGAELRDL